MPLALSSAGGIYVRDRDPALIRRLVAWLQEQPWCGPVSTRDGEGALRHDQLLIDHRRAPDIGLVLASDDRANPQGSIGHTLQNAKYPVGGGLHGGLHPIELQTWLAVAGDAFDGSIMRHKVSRHFGADVKYKVPFGSNVLSMPRPLMSSATSTSASSIGV